jgi:hypothetical protein
MHLAFSAGLCMLFCGNEDLDAERRALRHAMIVENLQQLYTTRTMIGGINTLALLLVTSALNGTTENPDFKETAKLMEMSEGGLRKKVDNIGFKAVKD